MNVLEKEIMEKQKTKILDFVKSILEFMKENSNMFNEEKLDIMCNMLDYINNYIGEEDYIVMNKQIQAIKDGMVLDGKIRGCFNSAFNEKDLMSLGTMYLMAVTKNKNIYMVDDSLIYYIINSLRGEEYKCYSNLLRGLLYPKLLEGVKQIQESGVPNTDKIRLAFNTLIDSKIIKDDMDEEKFENVMKAYLESRSILIDNRQCRNLLQ